MRLVKLLKNEDRKVAVMQLEINAVRCSWKHSSLQLIERPRSTDGSII